jgi:hypothetical protein
MDPEQHVPPAQAQVFGDQQTVIATLVQAVQVLHTLAVNVLCMSASR